MPIPRIQLQLRSLLACASVCAFAYSVHGQDSNPEYHSNIVGGIEQSYLSSEQSQTNVFIRVFMQEGVQVPENPSPETPSFHLNAWAIARDLGAPQANSTANIVSAVTNPDGTITSASLSTVGYSLDFLIGGAFEWRANQKWSLEAIGAGGATTPMNSTSASSGFVVPDFGTQECSELQSRLTGQNAINNGYSSLLGATKTGTAKTPCLFNEAGGLNSPVKTIAFAGINRSNFLDKWEVGLRSVSSNIDRDKCNFKKPCHTLIADFTLGKDAAITGGRTRALVSKIDAVIPFPYAGGYLYIFGTAAMRVEKNANLPPLILTPATSTTLTSIPNAGVFVEPYLQPDKDFYRIGVGLSLNQILSKVKN